MPALRLTPRRRFLRSARERKLSWLNHINFLFCSALFVLAWPAFSPLDEERLSQSRRGTDPTARTPTSGDVSCRLPAEAHEAP
jgi:hypothetical protein